MPWRDKLIASARKEFEDARHERDPEIIARLLIGVCLISASAFTLTTLVLHGQTAAAYSLRTYIVHTGL